VAAHVVIRDEIEQVVATQTVMPFDTIENDLVGRLIRTNAVEASVTELNAAVAWRGRSWPGRASRRRRRGGPSTVGWRRRG
jgi:hypothetical protein